MKIIYWHGYIIAGNEKVAIAVARNNPDDSHWFTQDPEVNNDAFVRACGWAYSGEDTRGTGSGINN